jgi:diacylglycerol O-acyltransferase
MSSPPGRRSVATVSTRHSMSPADAAWLRMDRPTNLMIVNSVLWFDEPVDWARCRAVFLERIVARFDRFRQLAADGLPLMSPHWQDDPDFGPNLHFHRVALPAPHDRAALEDFIGDRIATPLDHSRPLWEVYLIGGYGSGCAILVRIHHCVADGIALARCPTASAARGGSPTTPATTAAPASAASPPLPMSRPPSSTKEWRRCCTPAHAGALASTAAGDAQTLAKLLFPGGDPHTAIKGEQSVAHRVAWSAPVPLSRVKRAGRDHGARPSTTSSWRR